MIGIKIQSPLQQNRNNCNVAILKSAHDILRERLLQQAGVKRSNEPWWQEFIPKKTFVTLQQIDAAVKRKWCRRFFKLMRTRLAMGYLRYEANNTGPNKKTYDFVAAMESKIALYKETGNTEFMVDVGNYAMLEFKEGHHPNRHYYGSDDVGHAPLKK